MLPQALSVIVAPGRSLSARSRSGALFGAKRAAARSVGIASRASGRGGGTTLPGRVLLRLAPDAIARLGARLEESTVVSATNGKTTTAGMIAAILAADGRDPVHNRAGSNMTWGVATALLEQRGKEGLFEVDEAWLPKVAAELDPSLIVLGNLFRDQLDRYGEIEALADEWAALVAERAGRTRFVLNADDPLIADLGRDAEQNRRDGVVYFGIDDPRAGASRAPARLRRQALPPLRPPVRLRARLRRPSRPLLVRQLRRVAAQPRRRRDRDLAARHERLDGRRADPARRARASSCPSPASTTSTTPSPRSPPPSSSASTRSGGGGARRRARRLRPGRDDRGRGHAGLDPADQEPGGRQRGPAHAEARGRRRGLDLWIALNDRIADGRDVSWVWDADFELLADSVRRVTCAGTRAPEMALRLKYAGWPEERIVVEPGIERLPGPGGRRRARAPLRPPHLHRPARAAQTALIPRPGQGVLAMTERQASRGGDLA